MSRLALCIKCLSDAWICLSKGVSMGAEATDTIVLESVVNEMSDVCCPVI